MLWKIMLVVAALALPPLVLRCLGRPLTGRLLGVPYSFAAPTPARLRETLWNPSSHRILTPHLYGWGYSLNLHALGRRLGLIARSRAV